ncbi:MAG: hypothetical protein KJ666_14765 [Bacteroidetes bacterium]|nr:hypothetical protein [Bacteroidota bacterium]
MKLFRIDNKHRLKYRSVAYKIFHFSGKLLIAFFVIFLVILGFSQTATFRNLLRNEILSIAQKELNGTLEIENIYGTLVSNLSLREIRYNINGIDFVKAKGIYLSINPIALLGNTISIKNLILEEAEINLAKLENGKWIFENILKHPAPPDTTEAAEFDYDISVKNFELQRCTFRIKENVNSINFQKYNVYESLNFSDLIVSDLNLKLSADLSLKKHSAKIDINSFRFNTNTQNFRLRNFTFQAVLNPNEIRIKKFSLLTDRTNLNLIARIKDLNVFKSFSFEEFKDKYVEASIDAPNFEFNDLKTLIPDINMLNGNASLSLSARGEFANLIIDKLKINLGQTSLSATARILNLSSPEKLYITANIEKSTFLMDDVNSLLPLYEIPKFDGLGRVELTAQYSGEPANFNTKLEIKSSHGNLFGEAKFNFNKAVADYQVRLNAADFNLLPIIGIHTKINGLIAVEGEGFSPEEIHSDIKAEFRNSVFAGNRIDSSSTRIEAKNKIFGVSFMAKNEKFDISLNGNFDFHEKDLPKYDFTLATSNLDLAENVGLKDYRSSLNFIAKIRGESFDIDRMNSSFNIDFLSSLVNDVQIPQSKFELALGKPEGADRFIKVRSDFMDIDVNGDFLIGDLAETLPKNLEEIENEIKGKLRTFNPVAFITDTTSIENVMSKKSSRTKIMGEEEIDPEKNFNLSYNIKFRDFDLINIFAKGLNLNIDGSINGVIKNNLDAFYVSAENKLENFWLIDADMSRRIKGAEINFSFNKSNQNGSQRKMLAKVSASADKIIYNNEIENLEFEAEIDPNKFYYRVVTEVDSIIKIRSEGEIDLSQSTYRANIKSATLEFKKYKITNEGPLQFSFNKDKVEFESFTMRRKRERIKLSGEIGLEGNQKLKLTANEIDVEDILKNFMPENNNLVAGSISITADLLGNADNPIINSSFSLDGLSINHNELGELTGTANYSQKQLDMNVQYADTIYDGQDLSLLGKLPIDLTFGSVKNRLISDKEILIILSLTKFNLTPLQAFIPQLKSISGIANGDLSLVGTYEEPIMNGLLKVENAILQIAQNNLKYIGSAEVQFANDKIELTELKISNLNAGNKGGTFRANGLVELEKFEIKKFDFTSSGALLVLSNESKSVSPMVYGDLVLETSTPVRFSGDKNFSILSGDIYIKETSLTIPQFETQYQADREGFTYKFVSYGEEIDSADIAFKEAEKVIRKNGVKKEQNERESFSNHSVKMRVILKNNVNVQFIFSRELNQKLFADLKGEVIFDVINNQTFTQGEIELTPESYLIFYQKFNAIGTLRFERELSNPFLNVTATYNDYYFGGDTLSSGYKEVSIKLKLNGTIRDLAKNLVNNPENIEVTIDGVVDNNKDASDVVAFVLLGKFKEDLTAQDKNNAASSLGNTVEKAATSLLGSVVANFANQILGDVLRTVEIKKVGEVTKFNVEGKVENLRFKVGGDAEAFQNIGLANIQLEFPVTDRFFIRLERKQASIQSARQEEMINEVGLKYKFEF